MDTGAHFQISIRTQFHQSLVRISELKLWPSYKMKEHLLKEHLQRVITVSAVTLMYLLFVLMSRPTPIWD
jgi:hypothetical protein